MSDLAFDMANEAVALACETLFLSSGLTSEERAAAPALLRIYVDAAIQGGESDIENAAFEALGSLRQQFQLTRSRQRLPSPAPTRPGIAA